MQISPPSLAVVSAWAPVSDVVWGEGADPSTGPQVWTDLPRVPPLLHVAHELLYIDRLLHSDMSRNVDTLEASGLLSSYSHKTHYNDVSRRVDTDI